MYAIIQTAGLGGETLLPPRDTGEVMPTLDHAQALIAALQCIQPGAGYVALGLTGDVWSVGPDGVLHQEPDIEAAMRVVRDQQGDKHVLS